MNLILSLILALTLLSCQRNYQTLPITEKLIFDEKVINLEVAKTSEQKRIGLMNRQELPTNQAMIFYFEEAQQLSFWMKNTKIPLDLVLIKKNQVVDIIRNAKPCSSKPCQIYESENFADKLIELNAGKVDYLGIKIGDILQISPINN